MVSKAHVLSASSPDFRDIITLQASGVPISFAVSRLLCFNTGCVASTDPGGKVMSRRIMGGCTAAGVICEAGTGGPAFCIFIPECRNGDLLGEVRFSRGLGRGAGLDT